MGKDKVPIFPLSLLFSRTESVCLFLGFFTSNGIERQTFGRYDPLIAPQCAVRWSSLMKSFG